MYLPDNNIGDLQFIISYIDQVIDNVVMSCIILIIVLPYDYITLLCRSVILVSRLQNETRHYQRRHNVRGEVISDVTMREETLSSLLSLSVKLS